MVDISTARFGRVITAMVTPFDHNLNVDDEAVVRLSQYLVSHGSSSLVVAGTTGESATLSHHEKVRLFRTVKDAVGGSAKIIAGAGTNNTADSIALAREAEQLGADGLLLVTPYYNKPSQAGLYAHYKAIAEATSLPSLLYNVPGRTGVNLRASTCVQLAHDFPNIVGVKEAGKDLEQIGDIASGAPASFEIYSGDDGTTLPILALGGVGVISVTSHVNGLQLKKMHDAWFGGDTQTARVIHLKSLALTKAMFITSNPVPVKVALSLKGVLPNAHVRLPLAPATEDEVEIIRLALKSYEESL